MTDTTEHALLAPSDIAEIAGVSRAAVSNWRRRENLGFPAPTGGTTSRPLFDKAAVLAWLRAQGKSVNQDRMSVNAVWELINLMRGHVELDDALDALMTLACLRVASTKAGDGGWAALVASGSRDAMRSAGELQPESVRELVTLDEGSAALEEFWRRLPSLVVSISSIELDELPAAMDYAMERNSAVTLHRYAEYGSVQSPSNDLLAALVDQTAPADGQIYDPASGIASVLISALKRHAGRSATGVEISLQTARRAKQRALLSGLLDRVNILSVDTLQQDPAPDFRADVAVVEPPVALRAELSPIDPRWPARIPSSRADLAFVVDAIDHLKPTGRGFALLGAGVGYINGARALRASLLEKGYVEAVIALPSKTAAWTSIPFHLWVLGGAGSSSEVTFIDASVGIDASEAVSLIPLWLRGGDIDAPHATVPVTKIISDDGNLTPASWIAYESDDDSGVLLERAAESLAQLASGTSELNAMSDSISLPSLPASVRTFTIKESIKNGWLERVNSARGAGARKQEVPHMVTMRDVLEGALDRVPSESGERLTQPGDVVIAVRKPMILAEVDALGGHTLAGGILCLRVKDPNYLTPEYVALAITGSWNERHVANVMIAGPQQLEQMDIPVPPLEVQQELVELNRSTSALRQEAARISEAAMTTVQSVMNAVRQSH